MVILFTKMAWKQRRKEGNIVTDPVYTFDQQSASLHRLIPIMRRSQAVASVIVPELSFEASHKVKNTYLLGC